MDLNDSSSWKICEIFNSKSRYPTNVESWSKAFYITYIVFIILNVILVILTVSLNFVTILAYWKSTQLRKKISYFLIMLLSVIDFATGMCGNVGFVVMAVKVLKQDLDCLMFILVQLIGYSLAAMSLMTTFLLNAERYLSIVHPFFHRRTVTKSKLLLTAVILWCFAILVVTSRILINRITTFLSSAAILFIVIACVYFYVAIYLANKKARRECRSEEGKNSAGKIAHIQDMKLAKSCTIVVACAIVCFVPFAATNPVVTQSYLEYWLRNLVGCTFVFASSSLNSLIFFWQNPSLRNEAKRTLILCTS